ncbi:pseudouridine synthase [Dissulfurirhabdus thermomarina]|uniref:pseudouridine synthase n=1 Tax=Dissulfurirhabdus thermomarina TaxID=1765737 RepID=UPI00142EA548|nr:pseudouridine synthase [Dissulfurirhabdus thermomarina]
MRISQVLIALDQLVNTLCWWLPGGCWADETLSSRAWRLRDEVPWLRRWIDRIFWWQPAHCRQAYESERRRLQAPPELRCMDG